MKVDLVWAPLRVKQRCSTLVSYVFFPKYLCICLNYTRTVRYYEVKVDLVWAPLREKLVANLSG